MQAKIICSVPTVYQSKSITTLMGQSPVQSPHGNLVSIVILPTKMDAIKWLKNRAETLYANGTLLEWEYKEALGEIKKQNSLTYDDATANIEVRHEVK